MSAVVVAGGGLAGLLAAARLSERGHRVTLVTFGIGGLPVSAGCLDVLGYAPDRVADPFAALPGFCAARPEHPYAVLGQAAVRAGVEFAARWWRDLLVGKESAWLLPTAAGALRPTWLAHRTSAAADFSDPSRTPRRVVVAGPRQLKDFQPALVAGNLARVAGVAAEPASLDFPARPGEVDASALTYARALDDPVRGRELAAALRPRARGADLVLLPACLGLRADVAGPLADALGAPVAEVPLVPPSVPGLRLHDAAMAELRSRRVRIVLGARVVGLETGAGRIAAVSVRTSGHDTRIACDAVVYAPGGFESGALELDSRGVVTETALGLPVRVPAGDLITADRREPQPLFASGLAVDPTMRVLDGRDRVVHPNLLAAGGVLAGAQRWRELSGDGIAAASAVRAADAVEEIA